jgi:hypothetical protein
VVDDDPTALPVFGTLVTRDGMQFRVTLRCLREDLSLVGPIDFAQLLDGPVGATIQGHAASPVEDAGLSRAAAHLGRERARVLVHPSAGDGVLWIAGCGLDAALYAALDRDGHLWPTDRDRRWLADDRLMMRLRTLQVKAPLALAQAQAQPGEPCEIGGLDPRESVRIVIDAQTGATYVELPLSPQEHFSPQQVRRRLAVTLACVHPDTGWVVEGDGPHEALGIIAGGSPPTDAARIVFRRGAERVEGHGTWRAPRGLDTTDFKLKNVAHIREVLERHRLTCPDQVQGILLNPIDYMALDVGELWGIPLIPDETVEVKRSRFRCLGDRHQTEQALEAFLETTLPASL